MDDVSEDGRGLRESCLRNRGGPAVASRTADLPLHASSHSAETFATPLHLAVYGSDRKKIKALAATNDGLSDLLHPRLPYLNAELVWAAREEMARTVEDVLSRRTRALLLDSLAAVEAAPRVAEILAKELNRDSVWQKKQVDDFRLLARSYQIKREQPNLER